MMKRRFVSTFFAAAVSFVVSAVSFTPADNSTVFYKEGSSGEEIFVGESDSARIRVVFNLKDEDVTGDVESIDCYLVSNRDTTVIDQNAPVLTVGPDKCYHVISKTIGSNKKVLKTSTSHLCYVKKKSVAPTVKVCEYDSLAPVCDPNLKVKFSNLDYVNSYVNAKGETVKIEDNIVLTYIDYEAEGLTIKEKQMETEVSRRNSDSTLLITKPKRHTVFKLKDKLTKYEYVSDTFHTLLPFMAAQITIEGEEIPHNTEKRSDDALIFGTLDDAKSSVVSHVYSGPLDINLEHNSVDNTPADTVDARYTWKIYNDSTAALRYSDKVYSNIKTVSGVNIKDYGTYYVVLTCDNSVCKDTLVAGFKLKTSYLEMPYVFTPNGDGINEEFRPTYTSISEYKIWIYNTMGKEMYESEDITVGWDGTYKGNDAPIGAYYYVVKAKGVDGVEYKLKGTVNLVRNAD